MEKQTSRLLKLATCILKTKALSNMILINRERNSKKSTIHVFFTVKYSYQEMKVLFQKALKKDIILLLSIDDRVEEWRKTKLTFEARYTTGSVLLKAKVILQRPEEEVPSNPTIQQFLSLSIDFCTESLVLQIWTMPIPEKNNSGRFMKKKKPS